MSLRALGAALIGATLVAFGGCTATQLQPDATAGAIALACSYEPLVTGVVAAAANPVAIETQSYATAFCRNPVITAESATWLKGVEQGAVAQAAAPKAP